MELFQTISDAYLALLEEVMFRADYSSSPRGKKVYEILDQQYRVIKPSSAPIETLDEERNKVIVDYTAKELEWYISGDDSVESATKISKFWKQLANPDSSINSNYGKLIFKDKSEGNAFETWPCSIFPIKRTPYEWALQSLQKDKDSRQALIRINKPGHMWFGNKDIVCTLHMMFHIRYDKLHVSIVQRSCDLKTGFVYDVPFFAWVQNKMLEDLKPTYPELELGYLTHTIHSLHIYEKDWDSLKKMIGE